MNPAFRFARGGKVYKELESDEAHQIAGYLRTGIISPNDDYWSPGMADWKKVSSRQWNFPAPTSSTGNELPPLAQNNKPASSTQAGNAPSPAQAFAQGNAGSSYECPTCKKGFNQPAKAVSGYSVIGNATIYFLIGIGLMVLVYAIRDAAADLLFSIDPKHGYILFSIVAGLVALVALGLFLMSGFELISAAVTHGLYRANPERCPHCKSPTFIKKF